MDKAIRYPGYTALLPPRVRYDQTLTPTAKLLYAEITAMTDVTGFCWASNAYLGQLVLVSKDRAARLVGELERRGYLEVRVLRDEKNAVTERRLYVTDLGHMHLPPPVKNTGRGGVKNTGTPPGKNTDKNDTSINNPPYSPPKGGRRTPAHKDRPDWKPDAFEAFWRWYPHDKRGNRQRAIRAWDGLHPDDGLIRTIATALENQSRTKSWQDGVGITHFSTFLNGYGWEGWTDAACGASADPGREEVPTL